MNILKISLTVLVRPAIAASMLATICTAAAATDYQYVARTKAKAVAEQGTVKVGTLTWKCKGNECRISVPWKTPGLGACKALAQRVGPLASYGHSGHWLSGKELDACNTDIGKPPSSTGVAKDTKEQKKGIQLSTGVIQAPQGQLKKALPSPGVTQLPSDSLPQAALSSSAQIWLGQAELDSMARALNTIGSQRYDYVLFRRMPTGSKRMKLSVVHADSINGVLLNRDKAAMKSLGGRYFDDRMGNLVLLGHLVGDTGERFPYSITATSWGEAVYGADRDNDGVIDLALGSDNGGGRLWMMANDNYKRLLQCIEESALSMSGSDMFNAASLCVPCLDPTRGAGTALTAEELSCVNRRGSGGSGLLASALGKDAPNLYGEPDCGASRTPGGGITKQDRNQRASDYREQGSEARRKADIYFHAAGMHIAERDQRLAEMAGDLGRDSAAFANGLRDLADMIENGEDPEIIERTVEELNIAGEEIIVHHREYCTAGGYGNCTSGDIDASSDDGGEGLPRIGFDDIPQTGFADPRCSGNKTAMAQGTMWGDFCRNEDGSHIGMMECARRMADSIYAISGGRCWQEAGPAGGERIVCRREASGRGDASAGGPGSGSVGDSSSGPTEGPDLGRPRGSGGRYIDAVPMGAFLAGLCAEGHCPDLPPMDMDP